MIFGNSYCELVPLISAVNKTAKCRNKICSNIKDFRILNNLILGTRFIREHNYVSQHITVHSISNIKAIFRYINIFLNQIHTYIIFHIFVILPYIYILFSNNWVTFRMITIYHNVNVKYLIIIMISIIDIFINDFELTWKLIYIHLPYHIYIES